MRPKAKFIQSEKLAEMLIETGNTLLAEATPKDEFWPMDCPCKMIMLLVVLDGLVKTDWESCS